MTPIAHGSRDATGRWHADDPTLYPAMDCHGQLPWSVLDQSARHWRDRKRWWQQQGVDDLYPRAGAGGMIATGRHGRTSGGVSAFDPFLTELLVTWWCPPGGAIYDPFAGGPVRGIVAAALGRHYEGVELAATQVEANRRAAARWPSLDPLPAWETGDGAAWQPGPADMVMSCPPYHNRERYSDDPRDLSAMRWPDFLAAHRRAVGIAAAALHPNRWLAWVVSDVRDHHGHLRGLPAIAAEHIASAGLRVCNELILVAPAGTRAKTMRIPWEAARTVSRRHQIVIVAIKGDRRAAARACQGVS